MQIQIKTRKFLTFVKPWKLKILQISSCCYVNSKSYRFIEPFVVYFLHTGHCLVCNFLITKVISSANDGTVGVLRHRVQTSIKLRSPVASHMKERHFKGRALRRQNYLFPVHQPNLWQLANDFLIRSLEEVLVHSVRVNTTWILSISCWKIAVISTRWTLITLIWVYRTALPNLQ